MSGLFEVVFHANHFPAAVSKTGVLKFDGGDLAHALFVTGRAPGDQWAHGATSVWEWVHRASLVPAYVRRDAAGHLFRSALADSLDRSEKTALSYALGQAMTGIFCEQRLKVSHLMHVDRYASRWGVVFGVGRARPDLFGRTATGQWVVAEAKGRSNSMEPSLKRKLRTQKGMVREIAGRPPELTLGCVASFPTLGGGAHGSLRVDAFDPEPSKEAVRLSIQEGSFLRAYYEPFAAAIEMGEESEMSSESVRVAELPSVGLTVGLHRRICNALAERMDSFQTWPALEAGVANAAAADGSAVRSDGTFVRANWSDSFALPDIEKG